jgi:hypothetical protein
MEVGNTVCESQECVRMTVLGFSWHRTGYCETYYSESLSEAVSGRISVEGRIVARYNRDLAGGYVYSCLSVTAHVQCVYVTWPALNPASVALH